MNLYCWQHNTPHEFTPRQVEEVWYALTAAYAVAVTERDGDRQYAGGDADAEVRRLCPLRVLRWAGDAEIYGEHVEQGITCAKTTDPAPAAPAVARNNSGERSVRFDARFDSTCPACEEQIHEGDPVAWSDGTVVHDDCAIAAGVEVFDR